MLGIFYKDKSQYRNTIDPVKSYFDQLVTYISIKDSLPKEVAKEKAKSIFNSHFKDKQIKYFERQENGDRIVVESSLLDFIKQNVAERNILVPTFTSYVNADVKKSILSEFIFVNVKRRSAAKKEAQKAKAEGNLELAEAKNNEQSMMKIYNNSLSGAFAQEACILYNPTAHSTLTSITRTMTSLSNASNEKLIAGNRFYPRPIDVLNNIVYIITYADEEKIKETCEKYQLHLPSVEDTISVLKYSSDLYFSDRKLYEEKLKPFLEKLTPYQRAAICYIGDLYHLRVFNSEFIRRMIDEIIVPIESNEKYEDIVSKIHGLNENILNFVHHIFFSKVKGLGKDYEKMNELGLASSIYETAKHIESVFYKYKDFWNTFFMTEILPGNSFRLQHMLRRTVVLSDTDSTCYTLDEWVKWYRGEFLLDDKSIALAGCISFIAGQAIINQLAILSKNMNITDENLNVLSMKNEFLWDVHAPCEISKHYFAHTVIQEGNVFSKPELEVKGVHLKNSAVPKFIIEDGKRIMKYILDTVASNGKIKLNELIEHVKRLEENIKSSILRGEALYYKKSKIKAKEAYALDEFKSPYQRHQFWVDVFSSKYGEIQDPPYDVIKIPTVVSGKSALVKWLEGIEDVEIKSKLIEWLKKYKKSDLPTIYLNELFVESNGIPEEIIKVIDVKRIIMDVTMQHRIILETLGVMLHEELLVNEQFR